MTKMGRYCKRHNLINKGKTTAESNKFIGDNGQCCSKLLQVEFDNKCMK